MPVKDIIEHEFYLVRVPLYASFKLKLILENTFLRVWFADITVVPISIAPYDTPRKEKENIENMRCLF